MSYSYTVFSTPIVFPEFDDYGITQVDDFEFERTIEHKDLENWVDEVDALIHAYDTFDYSKVDEADKVDMLATKQEYVDLVKEARAALNEFSRYDSLIYEDDINNYIEELFMDTHPDVPTQYIDWDKVVDDYKQDFTEIEIGGYTFYFS